MTTLTMIQVGQKLASAGWPTAVLPTAIAIVQAESGGVVEVIGGPNSNGTHDYGLMQINSIHGYNTALLTGDAIYNCRAGLDIYNARKSSGNGFTAWSSYNAGRHLQFMERATAAASGTSTPDVPFPARLSNAERVAIYGDPNNPVFPVVDYTTPWGFTIKINSAILAVYGAACDEAVNVAWDPVQIQTFSIRPIRGGTSYSLHSWALAGDHFAQANPDSAWTPSNGVTQEFANCFIRRGFTWGANWDRVDVPHIEWAGVPPSSTEGYANWLDTTQNGFLRCAASRFPNEQPAIGTLLAQAVRRQAGGKGLGVAVYGEDDWAGMTDCAQFEWIGAWE